MKSIIQWSVIALFAAGLSLRAADVKQSWDKNCAKCHGQDGKGNTRMGKQSGAKDYTDPKVQAELKDDAGLKAIKEGITEDGKKKMDPYKEKLTDDEMKALLAYVRAFKK
jgi:cytochrome c553